MAVLDKGQLPPLHKCIFRKELLLGGSGRGILCKELLPEWESVTKALHTHKYIRKYKKGGRWIYIYKITKKKKSVVDEEDEHFHTTWNHVQHNHHTAPEEFRLHGNEGRREGAVPHNITKDRGPDAPEGAEDVSSHSLPWFPNHDKKDVNEAIVRKFLSENQGLGIEGRQEYTKNKDYFHKGFGGFLYHEPGPPESAVKFPVMRNKDVAKELEKEIEFSIVLGDPAIGIAPEVTDCRIGSGQDNFLATEWCSGGSLDKIHESEPEREIRFFEAVEKIEEFHTRGYWNVDIAARNIFIHETKGALMADFGQMGKDHQFAYFQATDYHYLKDLHPRVKPKVEACFFAAKQEAEQEYNRRLEQKEALGEKDFKELTIKFYEALRQNLSQM